MVQSFNDKKTVEEYLASDRWSNTKRDYSVNDICSLRSSFKVEHSLSEIGSALLLGLLDRENTWVSGLGAATAQQALQMFHLDYEIIYVSGWQVAAESNIGTNTYPDLSLYPSNSTPNFVKKINNTLLRRMAELNKEKLPPIVADGESGFGGIYNVYELTNQFIDAGVSGIHFEDQLASEKKCGHVGGKVVIPTHEYIKKLNSARLASDVAGIPIVIIARTDALNAKLITSDFDDRDGKFLSKKRTSDGYFLIENNHEMAISKSLSYAEYADVIWCETNTPDLGFAKEFADEIKKSFPNKILAYNCSPSFNWLDKFTKEGVENFQNNLNDYGYKLQFVSLAGFHSLASSMYDLANKYKGGNMNAIIELQQFEKDLSKDGYTGMKHQQEVGGNYYEKIGEALLGDDAELLSEKDSTENTQF
jgi:isocitrate lyase